MSYHILGLANSSSILLGHINKKYIYFLINLPYILRHPMCIIVLSPFCDLLPMVWDIEVVHMFIKYRIDLVLNNLIIP